MLVAVILLVSAGSVASAPDDTWTKLIAAGDEAMSKQLYAEAEKSYRDALQLAESRWKKDFRIAGSMIKLAESCNGESKRDEGEAFAARSIVALQAALKAHKPKNSTDEYERTDVSAAIFDQAAGIYAANQKYSDAEALYEKVIALREAAAVEKKPSTEEDLFRFLGQALTNAKAKVADANDKLADLYFRERKFEDATQLYVKSHAIREAALGPEKPLTAKNLSDLASCYAVQGNYGAAEPLFKQAVEIFEHANWADRPEIATALENYSLLLKKTGREAEAGPMMERAQAIRAKLAQQPQ